MRATCALLGSIPGSSSNPFTSRFLSFTLVCRKTQNTPLRAGRIPQRGACAPRLPEVELARLHLRCEGIPLCAGEDQRRSVGGLRITDCDDTRQVAGDLDTVIVGAAAGTLAPFC